MEKETLIELLWDNVGVGNIEKHILFEVYELYCRYCTMPTKYHLNYAEGFQGGFYIEFTFDDDKEKHYYKYAFFNNRERLFEKG